MNDKRFISVIYIKIIQSYHFTLGFANCLPNISYPTVFSLPQPSLSLRSGWQFDSQCSRSSRRFAPQDDSGTVSLTCYSKCHRCHVECSETSFTPFRPLSLISSFRFTVISTERSEWRNLFVARHRRRNIRPPTTTPQALRGARPQRALLAHGCCLLATYYVHVPARRVEKSYGNGVLGYEMPQTRPSGVDFIPEMHF